MIASRLAGGASSTFLPCGRSESNRVQRQMQPSPVPALIPGLAPLMSALTRTRGALPRPLTIAIALAGLALVALLDYVTGFEVDLSVLYVAPICLVAWNYGRAGAIAFCIFAAGVWLVNEDMTRHVLPHSILLFPHQYFHFSKAGLLLATWVIMALLIHRLKLALAQADERFRTVLEGLQDSVYVTDPQTGRLLYLNQRCRDTFGTGGPLQQARQIESGLEGAPAPEAGTPSGEYFHAGRERWYLLESRSIRWIDGGAVRLTVASDVTDRKRAEELSRQQQQKLQQVSHLVTVGEMASTLAHEMNQPLAAIVAYCMGCVRRLRSGSGEPEELIGAMEKASTQAERAGRIIHRVRELVRKREPVRLACDINAVVSRVAAMIEIDTEENRVRVRLDLAAELPLVYADAIMLEQAALNITRNGIDAMRETPAEERELTIRTRRRTEEQAVEIQISDSGCGIPEALQRNLFEPFFTTKAEGLGMGLSICRSIVEFHDGRLWAARKPSRGSTFHLTLPAYCPWTPPPNPS